MIAAVAENRVIGRGQKLPWHLPPDLKYFRDVTIGKPIIMGRLTFESVGKPLSGRKNIVVSRSNLGEISGVISAVSIQDALAVGVREAKLVGQNEIFVVGGAQIYQAALSFCTRIYITEIHEFPDGDIFFPVIDWANWSEVSREFHKAETGQPAYSFVVYELKQGL